jgi:hypothetical protein
MSELTTCNYCNLNHIKDDAKRNKQKVTVVPAKGKLGGFDVYVHPRGIVIEFLTKRESKPYWVAWMWEITDHCAC